MEEARNVLRLANKSKSVDLTVARDECEEAVSYKRRRREMGWVLFLQWFSTLDAHLKAALMDALLRGGGNASRILGFRRNLDGILRNSSSRASRASQASIASRRMEKLFGGDVWIGAEGLKGVWALWRDIGC